MPGVAILTEACLDVKDRACVDVCPVQCIYEFDPVTNALFSEAGDGLIENSHASVANAADADKGRDHTFFIQHNGAGFAD